VGWIPDAIDFFNLPVSLSRIIGSEFYSASN
jgi:hypothetical protein